MKKSALAWIGHPLTVASVFGLLCNDHLFKALWPGVVTGKLSDLAGLVVAPPLLNLVIRVPYLSLLLTGVLFTLVKTTAVGAAAATQAWTLVWGPAEVLADPTDLLALPALGVAWWIWKHPASRADRLARAVAVVPITVLAVAATAAPEVFRPYSAYSVGVIGEWIVVATRGGLSYHNPVPGFASRDGGRSWYRREVVRPPATRTSACAVDRCYRIVPGRLKVEESANGQWMTSWEISPSDQDRLTRAYPPDRPEDAVAAESLAIAVQSRPGGHVVVVANGADGIALRDVSGAWRRLGRTDYGFDAEKAVSLSAPGRYDDSVPVAAMLAALAAGLLTLACGVRRLGFVAGAMMLWAGAWLLMRESDPYLLFDVYPLLGLALLPNGLALMIVSSVRSPPFGRGRVWVIGVTTGVAVYFAIMMPVYGWSVGVLEDYSRAIGLAIGQGIATAATGVLVMLKTPTTREFHFCTDAAR
ncbi:hypothetical protein GCM10009555_061870 [Acrocarpospora macrocephala]|uniref:Uncharacterized protein n=1 Tax=Acrocarpospora macrocephala TaxID=150177 RepID=A0A5M3WM94_9ACTN|nr:hypothetical protein [Acrocarpospora macrocephala]GES09630.1 hypothetical protein Amac_032260 [Acrocarpospora macrocephala]